MNVAAGLCSVTRVRNCLRCYYITQPHRP